MDHRPHRVNPELLDFARELRSEQTPAEKKLWRCLRNRRLNDLKFRRQAPVGPYIADFFCPACRLIIELDGGSHFTPEQRQYDAERTAYLQAQGYRVVRFRNSDVHEHLEGVLNALLRACYSDSDAV